MFYRAKKTKIEKKKEGKQRNGNTSKRFVEIGVFLSFSYNCNRLKRTFRILQVALLKIVELVALTVVFTTIFIAKHEE